VKSLEELLAPVAEGGPAGSDMSGHQDYLDIQTAFDMNFPADTGAYDEDAEFGRPPPADWRGILAKIEGLSDLSKDLFLAASLARTGIPLNDVRMIERGLLMMAGLLEQYWDEVHPTLDDLEYQGRLGICEQIAGRGAFAFPLLRMQLLDTGRASFTGDDLIAYAEAAGAIGESDPIASAVAAMDEADREDFSNTLASIKAAILRVSDVMKANANGESPPDFAVTLDTLDLVKAGFDALAGLTGDAASGEEAAGSETDSAAGEAASQGTGARITGTVQSREDVLRALQAIEDYYTRSEPAHPLKVVMARLRGWVRMDFMEILEDISPRSIDDAKNVLLVRTDD
jgi:type VI secretion system protein ImpA